MLYADRSQYGVIMSDKQAILKSINIGQRIAEEEIDDLEKYFVETPQWEKLRDNSVNVVYGAKGTGKSALYGLLTKRETQFNTQGIFLTSAENVLGEPVFSSLKTGAVPSESSFKFLWKLYCLVITAQFIRSKGIRGSSIDELVDTLEKVGLLPQVVDSIPSLFKAVSKFVRSLIKTGPVTSKEYTISVDPNTGAPSATYKKELGDQTEEERLEEIPVDDLLAKADKALAASGKSIWILFDRLDVAFADSEELERVGLRALFRTYNDMKPYKNITMKIFVRDDIWKRVSSGGFSEASHVIKTTSIKWDSKKLLDLLVLRLLNNDALVQFLSVDREKIKASFDLKQAFLTSIFPDKVDSGKNLKTFDWIIDRIQDGLGNAAPRELIHFMEEIITLQLDRLSRSEQPPPGTQLFDRPVFKEALKAVSATRYTQTLVAEYPQLENYMKKLENGKCEQSPASLAKYWNSTPQEVEEIAEKLCHAGFFKKTYRKVGKESFMWYYVPYLYRSCLNLSRGKSTD